MFDVVVVGGGFRGLLSAYLAKKNNLRVAIIERGESLGGVLNSFAWNGYLIDRGVQLFDSVPAELQQIIVEDIEVDIEPITFKYASVYDGEVTQGFALPNYSSISKGDKEKILFEMVERIDNENDSSQNFEQFLINRYGPTATKLISGSFENIYRIGLAETDVSALSQTAFHRLYFVDDEMAINLKGHPKLDQKLAARRMAMGKVDDFVSFYPKSRAMKGIAEAFEKKLEEMGCMVYTSQEIESIDHAAKTSKSGVKISTDKEDLFAKKVIWCSPLSQLEHSLHGTSNIAELEHSTPMITVAFETEAKNINDYTYFHQFSHDSLVFRSSAMGVYSSQISSEGKTFVTAECPTDLGSRFWNDPESYLNVIWSELVGMGLVKGGVSLPKTYNYAKLRKTHVMPKVGHTEALKKMIEISSSEYPDIITHGHQAFLRRDIFINAKKNIGEFVKT